MSIRTRDMTAGRLDRVRLGMSRAVLVALGTSLLISAVMLLFGRAILSLFISGSLAEVEGALTVGYGDLSMMSIFLAVLYLLHLLRSALQGLGNAVLPMLSGVTAFIMRTSMVFILPAFIGERGVFLAEVSAWFGAIAVLIPSYFVIVGRLSLK